MSRVDLAYLEFPWGWNLVLERASPRVNLGYVESWTRDVFALGFIKPTELCHDLLRMGLGFCKLVRISKRGAWV